MQSKLTYSRLTKTVAVIAVVMAMSACAQTVPVEQGTYTPQAKALDLGRVAFPGGKTMDFTVGIGSGAFHAKGDPANVFYTVTDRGPNIPCDETQKVVNVADLSLCGGDKAGKVFPIPSFVPTIYKIALNADHTFTVLETVTLKGTVGQPISGLSNPIQVSNTEKAFNADGLQMAFDAGGLDVEALVKLSDGTFWISEEYGPSVAHIAADGRILERWVPSGLEGDLKAAAYPVKGKLPSILKWRKLNRGVESLAISPDEKFLYFAMQSPLAHPNNDAYKTSDAVRLLKIAIATGDVVGEYVYPLDDPKSFVSDNAKKARKQNDVKISEMAALGNDRLLVLERISKTTKFYAVDLKSGKNFANTRWDADVTSPSVELMGVKGMMDKGVAPLTKKLVLDTDSIKGMPEKIEGIGVIDANTLMLINDSDFGIAGDSTVVVVTKVAAKMY